MNVNNNSLSRRDFLKLSGMGLFGLFASHLPLNSLFQDAYDAQQGRVTSRLIWLYDKPSFNANRVKMFWRDAVVSISNATVSDDVSDYNRVWYEISDQGFAYSGTLQPVQTILNTPTTNIPATGILGEVTVPYTDAHLQTSTTSFAVYRMYYETTHWILSALTAPDGKIWYQVLDDKWNKLYYALGEHIRLIPDDELAPLSPDVPDADKRIEVRLGDQLVFAYENNAPVFVTRAATGGIYRDGSYSTPAGHFMTYHKRPTRHMAAGDITANGFDLPGVPWVMYITEAGISLHGTFWHNDFGHPKSHGCVNLTPSAAKWLFRWTSPMVKPNEQFEYKDKGTLVEIMK
ncbi:MAG TPA: L,D-transpeptidase [Anaerolineales bacterium]|jgi:lipoprotein-anchoring transpeptidase ErfK/SrfK|nr:L,D-transpeptidase [Anaerolineales bacterium]